MSPIPVSTACHSHLPFLRAWNEFAPGCTEYITRAQRLDALDTLMKNLMRITLTEHVAAMDYRNWLAMHRQMLATLREIRREMAAIDKLGAGSLAEVADRLAL